jgi:hypothetical protein
MDSQGKPTTPDAGEAPAGDEQSKTTKIKIELEYHLIQQRLMIRSQAATIMIEGVLQDAVRHVVSASVGGPLPADGIVRVTLEYDLVNDDLKVDAQAPRVVVLGVLQHALGAVTRSQILQAIQGERESLKARVTALEERLGAPKLILPGQPSGRA